MQSIMQSILLFLLFLFFQVIRSQNYGTQQSVNDPYKTNTGIFNFNNILRNGLATGVSTVETGSNILQQPLRAATNLFQYAPESAANIQPGQYNENPYNSSPYNENLNPIQQGINTATSNFNNIMGAGLTSGINALEAGASILQLPLQAATNQFQYAPEGAANIQPGQYNENPYNSSPYNENLNPNQQGMNALKAGASIQQLPLYAATNQFQYAPEGAANIQPGQYNENPYNSSPYNEHLNPNQQGMNALEAGASIQQLPLQAATNQFQYAPEGAANIQPGQYNENPYNSSPYNEHLNPNQQGMNALEAGASIQQLPLHAATNQFQYAPKGAANIQPGQYNENPYYNSSPYNENLNPIQKGINTATSNFNNIMGAGLTTGVTALGGGADILGQQLNGATNLVQNIPKFTSNGIDFLQNIGQTGTDMTNNVLKLSTAPIVAKLNKFGNVLNGFSSYSDPQNQIDQSNNIQVPSMNYEHRY
ncbi:uncharacterized protein LOC126841844 isoform X4 [Adelges cooleyi]|uniref:uncharacterized protein LOC126841844 isoform X4 n=1 Tax=Adelges cooleyi TaxID=133065 RepID=UPI0021800E36|nr:uncharacterized protein LOC126841844 isoform X4 [Adelges cooleyi]